MTAFFRGVLGFVAAGVLVGLVWLVLSETYRGGYDAGFKCAKYNICGQLGEAR